MVWKSWISLLHLLGEVIHIDTGLVDLVWGINSWLHCLNLSMLSLFLEYDLQFDAQKHWKRDNTRRLFECLLTARPRPSQALDGQPWCNVIIRSQQKKTDTNLNTVRPLKSLKVHLNTTSPLCVCTQSPASVPLNEHPNADQRWQRILAFILMLGRKR